MLHRHIQADEGRCHVHAGAPLRCRASFASQQVVGFQEEVQLREQDFGNFQDADAKEREKEDRWGAPAAGLLQGLLDGVIPQCSRQPRLHSHIAICSARQHMQAQSARPLQQP